MVLQLPERCFKPYGGKITTSFTKIGEFRGKNKQTNKPLQGLGGGKQGGNFRHLPMGEAPEVQECMACSRPATGTIPLGWLFFAMERR